MLYRIYNVKYNLISKEYFQRPLKMLNKVKVFFKNSKLLLETPLHVKLKLNKLKIKIMY